MGHKFFNLPSKQDVLMHHGIAGQKWGVRNGPPYPLNPEKDYSAEEKSSNKIRSGTEDYADKAKSQMKKNAVFAAFGVAGTAVTVAAAIASGWYSPMLVGASVSALITGTAGVIRAGMEYKSTKKNMEELKARRASEKKDKKTGLYLKNEESTPAQDAKNVNPYHVSGDATSSTNCQYCSIAYDMRRRGYDTIAAERDESNRVPDETKNLKTIYNAKNEEVSVVDDRLYKALLTDGTGYAELGIFKTSKLSDTLDDELSKEKNSHGVISCCWSSAFGSGHSMQYEVKDGIVTYIDSQTGKTYNKSQFKSQIVSQTCGRFDHYRLDDKKVNMKEVKKYVA